MPGASGALPSLNVPYPSGSSARNSRSTRSLPSLSQGRLCARPVAWSLLRKASEIGEAQSGSEAVEERAGLAPTGALGRMQAAGEFFRRYLERSGAGPRASTEMVRRSGFGK